MSAVPIQIAPATLNGMKSDVPAYETARAVIAALNVAISYVQFSNGLIQPASPADGEVAMLVQRNTEGVLSLQRVTVGAADSGGVGFRLLRVSN